jgi:hypothetical protein
VILPKLAVIAAVIAAVVSGSAVASRQAPTLTITKAACTACKWKQGWFKGRVRFSATVSGQSQLQATVRKLKTGKLVIPPSSFSVGAGTFTKTLKLSSRPLPGTYVVELTGTSGGVSLPDAKKAFSVPTPVEGVADRSYASLTEHGPAVRVFRHTRVIYAHFHFLFPPQSSKVRFLWRRPDFTKVGTVVKTYKDYFYTYLRVSGKVLEPGTYYCYMYAAGKISKGLAVRVAG